LKKKEKRRESVVKPEMVDINKTKKKIDFEGLREVIKEAKKEKPENSKGTIKNGTINPGEVIKF
jgi:hypothetical protein